jgi:hypothetical protein
MTSENVALAMGAGWLVSLFIGGPVGLLVGLLVTAGLTLTGLHVERQIRRDRAEHEAFLRDLDRERMK